MYGQQNKNTISVKHSIGILLVNKGTSGFTSNTFKSDTFLPGLLFNNRPSMDYIKTGFLANTGWNIAIDKTLCDELSGTIMGHPDSDQHSKHYFTAL